jgi:hypothetical protein
LLVVGGLGPNESDHGELFHFMVDTKETYGALPLKSNEIETILRHGTRAIIERIAEEESVLGVVGNIPDKVGSVCVGQRVHRGILDK